MGKRTDSRAQWSQLWPYLQPYSWGWAAAVICIFLHVIINTLASYFMGLSLDMGLAADTAAFRRAFIGMLCAWIGSDVFFYARYRLVHVMAQRVVYDMRQAAVTSIGYARLPDLEQKHSGDFVSRLSNDMELIQKLVAQEWVNLVQGIWGFLVALAVMLAVSWRVTLLTLIAVPMIGVVANALSQPLGRHTQALQAKMAAVNSVAQDATAGIVVTKAFNLQPLLGARFRAAGQQVVEAAMRVATCQGWLNGSMSFLSMLPFIVLFGFGGYEVAQGRLTIGHLLVITNLLNNLTWPLNSMARSWAQVKASLAAAQRVFDVIALPRESTSGNTLQIDAKAPYAIELAGVTFGYDPEQPVFSDLNLRIRSGEQVAIVGASGVGKSTLFSLLLGLRQPQAGQILFYGQPLDDLNMASVRQAMAYVPQEVLLFPASVAQNIAYGNLQADMAAIEQAAAAAYAAEFIAALPDSYETDLGEYGAGLSGGQKQRLALARAVIKDAPILLLDEATSALDTAAEAHVQQAIADLSRQRTTLIIAHRLATIRDADRIIVLDQGQVAETGTHAALLKANGIYARLYAQQFANADADLLATAVREV